MSKKDVREYNIKALAYIGDAVYELHIREHIMESGLDQVNKLHKKAIKYVSAKSQAAVVKDIIDKLTEEEQDIVRRGRNAEANTVPKNTDVLTYKIATGFEALIGYIYMKENKNRLEEIIDMAIKCVEGN